MLNRKKDQMHNVTLTASEKLQFNLRVHAKGGCGSYTKREFQETPLTEKLMRRWNSEGNTPKFTEAEIKGKISVNESESDEPKRAYYIEIQGNRGMSRKLFRKKFRTERAFDKWMDANLWSY